MRRDTESYHRKETPACPDIAKQQHSPQVRPFALLLTTSVIILHRQPCATLRVYDIPNWRQTLASPAMAPIASAEIRNKLCQRYQRAYSSAATIIGFGNLVKFISLAIGTIIVTVGFLQATDAGYGPLLIAGALVAGLSIAGGGWISGMVIQAQGQIIHSMLDTAVNTSPLLDNSLKAQCLGSPETTAGLIVRHGAGF